VVRRRVEAQVKSGGRVLEPHTDRGPLTVPAWYQYAPGGDAWVLTEAASRKARLIEAAGRFTLMVERVMPTVRHVSVEGPVTRTVAVTDELLREITVRYLPAVRKFFERWNGCGLAESLARRLRGALRERQGRAAEPTAVMVDSQIVKAADTAGRDSRGFHGGKKVNGRGRRVAADVEGWLLRRWAPQPRPSPARASRPRWPGWNASPLTT
jgi:hypothetical protein